MAPSTAASVAAYTKDEKVLCFHHELLYEAKVLEVRRSEPKDKTSPHEYRIHYKGWKNTWDDWVPQDRLRKLTEDNKELAANLKRDLVQPQPTRTSTKPASSSRRGKGQGSDLGSGRGSEERHSSVPAGGRGTKRGKDNDVEKGLSVNESAESSSHDSQLQASFGFFYTLLSMHSYRLFGLSDYSANNFSYNSTGSSAMSPSRHRGTTVSGRRVAEGRRRSKNEDTSRRSKRLAQQEAASEDAYSDTADDILARPPPSDNPEYISRATEKTGMFWAPLISGSTQEETDMMNQELAAAGKYEYPELYHAKDVETRINDPANVNRQLFFEGQDPGARLAIAGVPKEPINLDPPGTGSPFDALRYPKALVARLNRVPDDPDGLPYGWDDKALNKIPRNIIANLPLKTLAALPESFRSFLPRKILARDPEEAPENPILPAASRITRRSQRSSIVEDDTTTRGLEEPLTRLVMPAFTRLDNRSHRLSSGEEQTSTSDHKESRVHPILPVVSRSAPQSLRLSTEQEGMSIKDSEEPRANPMLATVGRPTRRSQRISALDEDMTEVHDLPAPEETGLTVKGIIYPPIPGIDMTGGAYEVRSTMPLHSPHSPAVRKRGKAAHACDYCRVKKLKCDGVHPSCNSCDNFGVRCSFRGRNEHESGEQKQEVEDEQKEQTQQQPLGQIDGPTDEKHPLIAANDVHNCVLMTAPQLEHRGLATAGDSGPVVDDSDAGEDFIDLEALHHRPFLPALGITRQLAGRFVEKSPTDHLAPSKTTSIPLKFYPKPLFSHMPNFPKKTRARTAHAYNEMRTPQEEIFMSRPSVRIIVPDHLKNLLVDDWENVTKSLLVVPLPSKAPVNFILDSYFDEEKGKRRLGSAEADVLEEFVAGMKVYFDKAIGKTLLYKFERPQWAEIRQLWESGKYPEWNGKGPGDAYGAEHLCRMLVNMPEMVAQTNMDVQSVNRLREEISRLCTWLARNSGRFFCAKYEKPTAEYIEGAR